jgi:SAM-dependent methyltransferase
MFRTDSNEFGGIPALFGREIIACGPRKRRQLLGTALEYWRQVGFPYEQLTAEEADVHFHGLTRTPLGKVALGEKLGSSVVGLRLANSYHPQMWHARSHGHRRCPYDYFQDDTHLHLMLERAPRFWPNARCWSAQAVRNLARIYSGGRVANFRPVIARNIINRFSQPGELVLDFSAGYGGRLLACLTLDRAYLGIDPAARQVAGLTKMRNQLRKHSASNVKIVKGCAEEILFDLARNSVDLVFSSPPFFNLEIYSDEPSQSSYRYKSFDEWCDKFLAVIASQCCRVLRRHGFFAIHVSSRGKYPLESAARAIAAKHFSFHQTVPIEMSARPLQRAQNGGACRTEPILVFRKR